MSVLESLYTTHFGSLRPCWEDASGQDWEALLQGETSADIALLRQILVQLQCPVEAGISRTEAYAAVTRRGCPVPAHWLPYHQPVGEITVFLHSTSVGRVPILEAAAEEDFIWLLRALVHKNEPREIPGSMGAVMLGGYNNWGRIRLRQEAYLEQEPTGDWPAYFKELQRRPQEYQDTLILLSHRPYSGVPAQDLSLSEEAWRKASLIIRREHELAHYKTKRLYGGAQNHIHDEIIADFMGITAAFGEYRPHYFLRFMGLEAYPAYRSGGRLENYVSKSALSHGEFMQLCTIVHDAAFAIEIQYKQLFYDREVLFDQLCRTPVIRMAQGRFIEC